MWMPAKTRVAKEGGLYKREHERARVCVSVSVSQLRYDVKKKIMAPTRQYFT